MLFVLIAILPADTPFLPPLILTSLPPKIIKISLPSTSGWVVGSPLRLCFSSTPMHFIYLGVGCTPLRCPLHKKKRRHPNNSDDTAAFVLVYHRGLLQRLEDCGHTTIAQQHQAVTFN